MALTPIVIVHIYQNPFRFFSFAAHFSKINVDTENKTLSILKLTKSSLASLLLQTYNCEQNEKGSEEK
jgi:hypothetical protein